MKFCIHLPAGDIFLEMQWDKENEIDHWIEASKSETKLAIQLGELIECCSEHK